MLILVIGGVEYTCIIHIYIHGYYVLTFHLNILAGIFFAILFASLPMWHSIWHFIWHAFLHVGWNFTRNFVWHAFTRKVSWTRYVAPGPEPLPQFPAFAMWHQAHAHDVARAWADFAVEIRQCPLWSGPRRWDPAVPSEIRTTQMRSRSSHWDQDHADEIPQCPLRSGAGCSRPGRMGGRRERRREEETLTWDVGNTI